MKGIGETTDKEYNYHQFAFPNRPIMPVEPHIEVIPPPRRTRFSCPKCGSEETQNKSVAYAAGTKVGPRGTEQSVLAATVAPPAKPGFGPEHLAGLGVMLITAFALMAFGYAGFLWSLIIGLILAAVVWFALRSVTANRNKAAAEQSDAWASQQICLRCGGEFVPF
jgi:hypothetical protein